MEINDSKYLILSRIKYHLIHDFFKEISTKSSSYERFDCYNIAISGVLEELKKL